MTNADDTNALVEQLVAHRATLAVLLSQLATHTHAYAPPALLTSMAEARAEIARLKAQLRAAGVAVDDAPGDEPTTVETTAPFDPSAAAMPQLARMPLDAVPDPALLPRGSRMPLSVNPFFVGREPDLLALAAALKAGTTTVVAAATGMGGVGKTQLASEFAHRYGQFFAGGVFWLSFADPAGVEAEIAACGAALDLPSFAALDFPDQVARVRQLWQEPIPRLLVFDNCEDEALLRKFRPTSGGCRVLVTSRRQHWDAALGMRERYLNTLSRPESIALLRQFRSDLAEDDGALDSLALALGDLPLALHVAGSYLKRYQQAVSPAQYLEKLHSAPLQAFALRALSATPTAHERDVALTVATSYQRLDADQEIDALALAVLACAARCAPSEPIPRALLEQMLDLSALPADEQDLALEDALIRLDELGLREAAEGEALRIHRLIAAFVLGVSADGAAQAAVEKVLAKEANRLADAGFPTQFQPILPHLRHVCAGTEGRSDIGAADLAHALGRVEYALANYATAQPLYERALSIREQALGPQHPDIALYLNDLAELLRAQSKYVAARPLYERALAIREHVLGPEHRDTATSLNNLALLFRAQGNYQAAHPLLERAFAIRERELGPDHHSTASSMNNLALVLQSQGEYTKARTLLEQALSIREKALGPLHPNTAQSLNNLAYLLRTQGEYVVAQSLYERALVIYERELSPQHPSTAITLNNLAELLRIQGKDAVARPLYERALAIYEEVLGEEHPNTATGLSNLALLLQLQGDYAAARPLFERALAIREHVLGKQQPETATSLSHLATILRLQGEYAAARPLYERALVVREQVLGPEHPDTATTLNNLALLLRSQGDYAAARPLFERALAICEARLGTDHPSSQTIRRNLAALPVNPSLAE